MTYKEFARQINIEVDDPPNDCDMSREITIEVCIYLINSLGRQIRDLQERSNWHYVDEEMPELSTTVLVVVETDSPFGKGLGSYLDNYEQRTGWGRTIKVWNRADRNGDRVLAWLPIPKFERKEKDDGR